MLKRRAKEFVHEDDLPLSVAVMARELGISPRANRNNAWHGAEVSCKSKNQEIGSSPMQ